MNTPATAHPGFSATQTRAPETDADMRTVNIHPAHVPLRGEPWGEAGGLECKEDAMDIVSSVCFLLLTSSDKLNDFCGEPVPMKTTESLVHTILLYAATDCFLKLFSRILMLNVS